MMKRGLIPLAMAAVLAVPAAGAPAGVPERDAPAIGQQTLTALLGCWRLTEPSADGSIVCILPGADASSVRIATVEEDRIVEETALSVDGVGRQVEEGGCTGTETATWSRDGGRIFLRTELDCNGIRRVSTGVIAMVAENEWVDVQSVSVGGQQASRTLRYRAIRAENVPEAVASQLPRDQRLVQESARLEAAAPLDYDDVVEASGLIAAPAVEALLAARKHGWALNAQRLLQLESAGVPATTIDMMIALSYPSTFVVEERRPVTPVGTYPSGMALRDDCYDPYFGRMSRAECEVLLMRQYGRYGYRGSLFGYGYGSSPYGYGYSPWGYDPYGWNYGQTPIVIVRPDTEQRQRGEVVKGQGYTRGSGSETGRSAQPRSGSSSGSASGSSSAGSSQPASTSSGNSSSGRSTGRTAVPRNGGGGGQEP